MRQYRIAHRLLAAMVLALVVPLALAGCGAPPPAPATAMPVPPTETPVPTAEAPEQPAAPEAAPAWNADGVISEGEYTQSIKAAGVTFYWTTDGEFLYGALSGQTKGWLSVGFDPDRGMQGANYVYGYVKDGAATVLDMFGTKPSGPDSHPPDTNLGGTNDIVASGGLEADGSTTIEFQIPLDSGDAYDKPLAVGESYVVLLAWGPNDDLGYHGDRGQATITIRE
ncbi:MAG: hypothetical protein FJZ90_00140 [Chloroflexi bacterium]|nr:hypothetical protein [Chloroflexota bacterium]